MGSLSIDVCMDAHSPTVSGVICDGDDDDLTCNMMRSGDEETVKECD